MANRGGTQTRGEALINRTNDGVSLDEIFDEITEVLDLYNKHRSAIASLLSYPTTNVADAIAQDVRAELFEESTQVGQPVGISDPSYLKLAYNFKDYDLGLRMTRAYIRDASSEQIQNRITRALEADNTLTTNLILQRLFDPTVRTNDFGLPVFGLWNGVDAGGSPPNHLGRSFTTDHTHYLTTESLTLDPLHVQAGIAHVTEHGYGSTQAARLLLLIHPDDLVASKLTSWRAGVTFDTNKTPAWDFIPSSNAVPRLTVERVEGAVPPPDYNGLEVTGSYGKALVIESYFVPKGWCTIVASGGPDSVDNPVGFRQHARPEYQGLRRIDGGAPYPLIDMFLTRGCGTGIRHRGAAVAIQITAGAVYAPPVIVAHR